MLKERRWCEEGGPEERRGRMVEVEETQGGGGG